MPSPLNGLISPAASPTNSTPRCSGGGAGAGFGARGGGGEAPVPPDGRQPLRQQPAVVDVAEVLGGVEQPKPDVEGAVGQREHPAVAGQQLVAAPQLEVGVETGGAVAAAGDVHAAPPPRR